MGNDFVFGNYTPYNTIIHKIDCRLKLFFLVILMVAVFLSYGTFVTTLIIDGILLVLISIIMFISKIKFITILKSLKFIWITFLFIFLINIFLPNKNYVTVAFDIYEYNIYWESILQSFRILLRLIMMILLTVILTSTTKSTDLSFALEWYMYPLKLIKFPVSDFAMIISLVLRCIPLILNETTRIKKAQESRGANFTTGNIFKRIITFTSIIVPLLLSAISRSLDMADAMTIRGFIPSKKRTRYHIYKFSLADLFSFIFVTGCCCFLFYLAYMQFDLLEVLFNFTSTITVLR